MKVENDTPNYQFAAMQGDRVMVLNPKPIMTPDEARLHAAWLVTIAETIDPTEPELDRFHEILKAVRGA